MWRLELYVPSSQHQGLEKTTSSPTCELLNRQQAPNPFPLSARRVSKAVFGPGAAFAETSVAIKRAKQLLETHRGCQRSSEINSDHAFLSLRKPFIAFYVW